MKVESFIVGVANGIEPAFKFLDQCVADLGDVMIHSVTDTSYPKELNRFGCPPDDCIVRVVVYTPLSSGIRTSFPAI